MGLFNKNKKRVAKFENDREFRELTLAEMDQVVATGQYTAKEMCTSESYTQILQTKSILKKLHQF